VLSLVLWSAATLVVGLVLSVSVATRPALRAARAIDPWLTLSDIGLGFHRIPTSGKWKLGWGFMFGDPPSPSGQAPLRVFVGMAGRVLFTEPPTPAPGGQAAA
jgi:hypothetical protein